MQAKNNGVYTFQNVTGNHSIFVRFCRDPNSNYGIEDIIANQLQIYPNPAENEVFINSDLPIEKVEIYSITGALLVSEDNFKEKISVSALSQGIYFLKVYTTEGLTVRKIVKE